MNAKEYLQQVRRLDVLIESKSAEIEQLRNKAQGLTRAHSEWMGSGGGNNDKMADAIATIIKKEDELADTISEYVDKRTRIMRKLENIKEPALIEVLYRRYFRGQQWETIAYEMNYSYQHIHRLHQHGLNAMQRILDRRTK